jgi:serine/threonine protein kinase
MPRPSFDKSFANLAIDIKPDNIFLNWYVDSSNEFHLGKVVLGDIDCALKLKGRKLLNYKIGNVMWRSPEGQLGRGVGKPSEVFSFALLVRLLLN